MKFQIRPSPGLAEHHHRLHDFDRFHGVLNHGVHHCVQHLAASSRFTILHDDGDEDASDVDAFDEFDVVDGPTTNDGGGNGADDSGGDGGGAADDDDDDYAGDSKACPLENSPTSFLLIYRPSNSGVGVKCGMSRILHFMEYYVRVPYPAYSLGRIGSDRVAYSSVQNLGCSGHRLTATGSRLAQLLIHQLPAETRKLSRSRGLMHRNHKPKQALKS